MIEVKDIGELRNKITIETPTASVGTNGERTDTWATHKSVWAKVEYVNGGEAVVNDVMINNDRVVFTVRYDSTFTTLMRVLHNSIYYDIIYVQGDVYKHWTQLVTVYRGTS